MTFTSICGSHPGDPHRPSSTRHRRLRGVPENDDRKLNTGGDNECDTGICGFAPWEHPWDPDVSQIIDFVDQSLIWLFKQTVYSQSKHWLGSETPHDTEFLLKTIKPSEPCYCGSGKNYAGCHRGANRNELYGDARAFFEAWLSAYRSDHRRFELISDDIRRMLRSTNVRVKRA